MRAAPAAGAWCYHHWRRQHNARCRHDGRSAVVHATIVTVPTAAAVGTAMKARSTAARNRNCQTGLCLFERCERHCLCGSNAKEADATDRGQGNKFVHSFLLWFVRHIFSPPTFDCSIYLFARESVARISRSRKLSHIVGAVKNRVICRRLLSEQLYRLGSTASDRDVASSTAFRRHRHFFLDVLATAHTRGVNHVNEICGLNSAVAVVTIVVVICRKCIEAAVRRKIIEVSVIARVPEILSKMEAMKKRKSAMQSHSASTRMCTRGYLSEYEQRGYGRYCNEGSMFNCHVYVSHPNLMPNGRTSQSH